MGVLKQYPRLLQALQNAKPHSGRIKTALGDWFLMGPGLLVLAAAVIQYAQDKRNLVFALITLFPALFLLGVEAYILSQRYKRVFAASDSWQKVHPERLREMDETAHLADSCAGCLMFDEDLACRTSYGDVYLRYEDILWVYGMERIQRLNGIPISHSRAVNIIDIDGKEFELMTENGKEGMPASAKADILLKRIGKAGYSPVAGYDGELYNQTRKDLNVLKRRYEQSMNEQFEREARTAKWICPHCTAENEGTERCIYCGCLREIHIPDKEPEPIPVQPAPAAVNAAPPEKDYSYLEPNVGASRAKKSNPMLIVLLAVACVAVMAIALFVAGLMNKREDYSNQQIQDNPVDNPVDNTQNSTDGKLLDGYVGDTISTAFFDMTVNSAYMTDRYEGMTPAEGNEFCVVNMTIHNTLRQSLPMFDTDFVLWWGQGDEDGSFPITHEAAEKRTGNMLEEEYFIGINETVTGDLVYELPKTHDAQGLVYFEEYFDNGETGEYYTFTVDLK